MPLIFRCQTSFQDFDPVGSTQLAYRIAISAFDSPGFLNKFKKSIKISGNLSKMISSVSTIDQRKENRIGVQHINPAGEHPR